MERLDGSPRHLQIQRIQAAADASPRSRALAEMSDIVRSSERESSLPDHTPAALEPNRTGLPNSLKAGVEALSGLSVEDVRVHRNSARPSEVNALAYAEGSDIHLSPGADHHLAHEAWHVVQQKQGRVQPTAHVRGVAVNDDVALEREADVMGQQAAQLRRDARSPEGDGPPPRQSGGATPAGAVQRKVGFEFEDGTWGAWEKTSLGTTMPPMAKPVPRKAVLHRGTHFTLEGDDTPGPDKSNLEFVTDPFDATATGMTDLMTALEEMGEITVRRLGSHAGQPGPSAHAAHVGPGNLVLYETGRYVESPQHQLGGGHVAAADILLSGGAAQGSFKMQATMGMSLESLPTVMRYFGRPANETAGQAQRRAGARKLMRGAGFAGANNIASVVGQSPELAQQVLTQLVADPALSAGDRAALNAAPGSLHGLLSAMMMYMKMLQLPMDGVLKYRIPFLGRSDFGAMFHALPAAPQPVLQTHANRLAHHLVTVSNGTPLLGRFNGKDSDVNLTVNHPLVNVPRLRFGAPPAAVVAMTSLTIGAWVRDITGGIDWLTPANVDIWMNAMSAAGVAPTTAQERQDAVEMLESFASIGVMDVGPAATPLAVMENRAIAPTGPALHGNDLNFWQAAAMARDYLQFFINLAAHPHHPGAFPEPPA